MFNIFVAPDCSWLETNSPPHGGCTWRNRARAEGVSGTHSYSRREYDLCLSKTRGVNAPVTQVTGDTTPRGSSPPGASGVNPSFLNPSFLYIFFLKKKSFVFIQSFVLYFLKKKIFLISAYLSLFWRNRWFKSCLFGRFL